MTVEDLEATRVATDLSRSMAAERPTKMASMGGTGGAGDPMITLPPTGCGN